MSATGPETPPPAGTTPLARLNDFSLVSGGPLYQLFRRTHLSDDALQLVVRRVVVLVALAWLPLLVLSLVEGQAWGGVSLPFLKDFETQLRLLLAMPLLILAEIQVHQRQPQLVQLFVTNSLIADEVRPRFDAAIASALRLRNSVWVELALIAFVYGIGMPLVWRNQFALEVNSWFAAVVGGDLQATWAGRWFVYVSMPVFMFLLLRWYFRFLIWARFLWQVSRMPLKLEPTHPDRTAGLLFLARTGRAYMLVAAALGTVLSGMIANRIFHTGATLLAFKAEIAGTAAVLVVFVFGPLIFFYPALRATRRRGMTEYGTLGQAYARDFHDKWIRGPRPADETLLGHGDIQSLADLHNSFEIIRGIRLVPFTMNHVTSLAVTTLLPVAPLLLTTFSVEQLVAQLLKILL
jgi:hypothetical protein